MPRWPREAGKMPRWAREARRRRDRLASGPFRAQAATITAVRCHQKVKVRTKSTVDTRVGAPARRRYPTQRELQYSEIVTNLQR
jgi:hypothetical protein